MADPEKHVCMKGVRISGRSTPVLLEISFTKMQVVLGKSRLQLCTSSSWLVVMALIFVIDVYWLPELIHLLVLYTVEFWCYLALSCSILHGDVSSGMFVMLSIVC